jgi:hypothetical protein
MPGSVHWMKDPDLASDPDPALFVSGFQDANFFCFSLIEGTVLVKFTSVSKTTSHLEVIKVKIKFVIVVNQQGSK